MFVWFTLVLVYGNESGVMGPPSASHSRGTFCLDEKHFNTIHAQLYGKDMLLTRVHSPISVLVKAND